MTLRFYMTPGSCSTGIHILLEEIGLVFEAYIVNLLAGEQYQADYLAINPKASIPALVRDDGSALTEFQAIAWWLAKHYPRHNLLPESYEDEARVLETMNFAVNTLHGQGFARIFTNEKFSPNPDEQTAVKAQGLEIIENGFRVVNTVLSGRDYVCDQFSIADAALFYVEFWADRSNIPMPDNCRAHYRKLLKRPAVRQVLQEEGYASALQ